MSFFYFIKKHLKSSDKNTRQTSKEETTAQEKQKRTADFHQMLEKRKSVIQRINTIEQNLSLFLGSGHNHLVDVGRHLKYFVFAVRYFDHQSTFEETGQNDYTFREDVERDIAFLADLHHLIIEADLKESAIEVHLTNAIGSYLFYAMEVLGIHPRYLNYPLCPQYKILADA